MRGLESGRLPLPSVARVPIDPPFALRFERNRLYRIEGQRQLFCAVDVIKREGLTWSFASHSHFVPYQHRPRAPRHFYRIRETEPERVLTLHGYLDGPGEATRLDWRDFWPTDYVREGKRWRVYRPLANKASASGLVR